MKIFIGGSVREQIDEKYKNEAQKLADIIVKSECDVMYCASRWGEVGIIYNELVQKYPDRVHTAVPKAHLKYKDTEITDKTVITNTINERTDYILKNSDVCIFLPGGIGSIYEIMSSIETKRASEHNSKLIIVNLFGYYDDLIKMLDKVFEEDFADKKDRENYVIVDNIEDIKKYIKKEE